MKVQTSRFGEIEIDEDKLLNLPNGLIGFPEVNQVAILEHRPGSPFRWLQCIDRPETAFVIVDPMLVDADYPMTRVLELLDEEGGTLDNLAVAVLASIPPDPEPISLNLLAPVAFNADTRRGAQVILSDTAYSSRHIIARDASPDARV
jgi:flagellar assembly factor FliW